MPRLLAYLLSAAILAGAALPAQEQQEKKEKQSDPTAELDRLQDERLLSEVTERLRSSDAATVAWGGYLAQRYQLKAAATDLRQALATWAKDTTKEGGLVRLSLLDAFLQLDISLWASDVQGFVKGVEGNAAFLLLVRTENSGALFELFRTRVEYDRADDQLVAMAQLLSKDPPAGFLALLLRRTACSLEVVAVTPGKRPEESYAGFVSGFGTACSFGNRTQGFPPTPQYQLILGARKGARVLMDGNPLLTWMRTECRSRIWGSMGSCRSLQPIEPLLRQWLDAACPEFPALHSCSVAIEFTAADDFKQRVETQRAAIRDSFAAGVAVLRSAGRLTADEAKDLRPRIEIHVEDQRVDRRQPLPSIEGARTGDK